MTACYHGVSGSAIGAEPTKGANVTSTETRYAVGQSLGATVYTEPRGNWCRNEHDGYVCTLQAGHDGDQHVGAVSYGEIVAVWDRPADEERVTPLQAFKRLCRDEAKRQKERGFGDWEAWNATMTKLGLEPFTVRKTRIVAPITRVVADLPDDYTEEQAREWLEARRYRLSTYLRPEDDAIGEPMVEVEASTPGVEDVDVDHRAHTDDLDTYRDLVRDVALEMAEEQSWCDPGTNEVLAKLGLPPKSRDFVVDVQIRAYQTVSITVTAATEEDALNQVGRYEIRDRIDSSEWEWDGDWDSDDMSASEA